MEEAMALQAFVWVRDTIRVITNRWKNGRKSGIFRAWIRIEIETSTVKEDGRLQMLPIAEPIGVFLIVWIFELSPSLVALVIRWSKYVKTLSRCPWIIRATLMTGFRREWVAQKYQRLQCRIAQPLRRYAHRSRSDSLIAHARPVFKCSPRRAANRSARRLRQVLLRKQPQVFRPLESLVALRLQPAVFPLPHLVDRLESCAS